MSDLIPPYRRARCEFCGDPVDVNSSTTYVFVSGWARNRTAGGTNGLSLAERSARWACRICIDSLRSGGIIGQEVLFDEA